MNIEWTEDAWQDYLYWQTQDKKTVKRINMLVKDILRQPFGGIGKPEPLRGTCAVLLLAGSIPPTVLSTR